MDTPLLQQALTLIRERKTPLIVLPKNASSDAIAAGLGLYMALQKLGKRAKVVSPGFVLPPGHGFLPKSKEILTDVSALRKFVITVDTRRAPLEELSYDLRDNQLHIYLMPKRGSYEAKDLTTNSGQFTFDLAVTIDAPNLESLGKLYDDNREFFYHTPLINIDHNPANDRFGHLPLVDVTASSSAEIVFELLDQAKSINLLDEYIATALLTGMIAKTKSFQSPNVTPRSLAVASHLISSGARRDDIIKNLYQTKSLSTLKLWGRALMRLQSAIDQRFVFTALNEEDLQRSGASLRDVPGVIDELIANTAGAEVILVLAEVEGETYAFCSTTKAQDALQLFKAYQPLGNRHYVTFGLKKPVKDAQVELAARVEQHLRA
ncbi:MAG: hypothetical protein HYZ09_03970 [Candidatus Kerfeldbacteria bacterium]|nr:hypothetical protein [Candidatus Kerfeldbacteria bacterium]